MLVVVLMWVVVCGLLGWVVRFLFDEREFRETFDLTSIDVGCVY